MDFDNNGRMAVNGAIVSNAPHSLPLLIAIEMKSINFALNSITMTNIVRD